MGFNLITGDLCQMYLLPPDVREWLPEDHLAWFVLEVVDEVDLSAFYAQRRLDGRGGAAYDPSILLAVLVYAYCIGERSSRRIERRLHEDIAFRVLGRNLQPDHATLARFRATFEEPLAGLFSTVLALCARSGLIDLGLVAVDGTKLHANASLSSNHSADGLRKLAETEAQRILDEAAAVDAAEDAGACPPTPRLLADRERRRERIRALLDELDSERVDAQAAIVADREEREQPNATGGAARRGGRRLGSGKLTKARQVNLTDPESRIMMAKGRFVQSYNAQVAVTADQIVIAAQVWQASSDAELLAPTLTAMATNLTGIGADGRPSVVLADAGYWSAANAGLDAADLLLIATTKGWKLHDTDRPLTPPPPPSTDGTPPDRYSLIERVEAGEILARDAAQSCGVSEPTMSRWRRLWRGGGRDAIPMHRPNAAGIVTRNSTRPVSEKAEVRRQMEQQLRSDDGKALYKRRSGTVEPVFGQIKTNRRIDRFQRRGLAACAAEWQLITATHNLLKLWNHKLAV